MEQALCNLYAVEKKKNILYIVIAILLVFLLGVLMMTIGNTNYSPKEVFHYLFSTETKGAAYTIKSLRLPKLIVGGLAGFAFGISGYTFQSILKNPLASPDIIGVTSGSSAAAVFCILILGISGFTASVFAIAAGLLVTLLILVLSGKGHAFGSKMILIGIGFQAALNALISWMLQIGSEYDVASALRWLRGSLNYVQLSDVLPMTIVVMLAGSFLLVCNRSLGILQLGEEYATALGVSIKQVRICTMIFALLLSATATAVTGPIASVAFLSGPIAGRITKGNRITLFLSGLIGAILVYAAELVGKNLFQAKYPVGVITGLLGAPYLLIQLFGIHKKGEKI